MITKKDKTKLRIRAKVSGSGVRPRVTVFVSNKNIYLQAVDDKKQVTIASASTLKDKENTAEVLAKQLNAKKITKIVFDRAGLRYHGKVKKIADDLRKSGLEF